MFQAFQIKPLQGINLTQKQADFLDVFRATGDAKGAAEAIGEKFTTVHKWRQGNELFSSQWDKVVHEDIMPMLEGEAIRRALNGSDLMLIFLLKANNRKRYDDTVARQSQTDNGIQITIEDATSSMTAAQRAENLDEQGRLEFGAKMSASRDQKVSPDPYLPPDPKAG